MTDTAAAQPIAPSVLQPYNVFQVIGSLSSVLLVFFMIMLSLMNQNFKGIVYIIGACFAILIGNGVSSFFPDQKMSELPSGICNLLELPLLTNNNVPANSSLLIWFTFAYLYYPMKYNKQWNYGVILGMAFLFVTDTVSKLKNNCNGPQGILLGSLLGLALGGLWYSILHSAGANSLLYYNEVDSNAVRCDMPSQQTFKCSVYKNGELVSSSIA